MIKELSADFIGTFTLVTAVCGRALFSAPSAGLASAAGRFRAARDRPWPRAVPPGREPGVPCFAQSGALARDRSVRRFGRVRLAVAVLERADRPRRSRRRDPQVAAR